MFVILTTADTEIQALAAAVRRLPDDFPAVRARNANELQSAQALDRFVAEELPGARAVVVRVLGGRPYFADGALAEVRRFLENPVAWSAAHGGIASAEEAAARRAESEA